MTAQDLGALVEDGHYNEAIAQTTAALEGGLPRSPAVLLLLGKALTAAGRDREAKAVFDEVVENAVRDRSSMLAADALEWLSWLAWIALDGNQTRGIAEQMRALEVPAASQQAFELFVGQATLELQLGDAASAARILDEAEHVSRDANIESFASYLSVKADVLAALGNPENALGYAQLAADISGKRRDRYPCWRRYAYLGYSLYANGRLRDAFTAYGESETFAVEAGLTWEVEHARARRAYVALLLGRIPDAHALIAACFERPLAHAWALVTRAWVGIFIGLACGDRDLVKRCADPALLDAARASADFYSIGPTVAAFHAVYASDGRTSEARDLLARAIARMPSPDCCWSLFPAVAADGSDAAVARAHTLLATFPTTHRVAQAHRRLFAAIVEARHGNAARSEAHAGEAQLLFEDVENPYYAARALEYSGRLSEAHQRFTAMGAHGDAHRLDGVSARRGRPRESYEATRQRREILALLVAGKTTADIAERFGVTPRTIKNRIAEIYAEHGVTNRAELTHANIFPSNGR